MGGDWRLSTWGDEVSLEYGKALRNYDKMHGRYPVFGSNGPIGWTDKPLTSGPGIILGRKGAYRGVEFCAAPFFVIDTAYYVVPKSEFEMRWLYYAIKHHKLGEIDDGSPIPSTTRAAVYVRKMEIPPLPEQRAIANILGSLDDKIELNRRMNETLEGIARALFKSWFVDFDPVRAKMDGRQPAGMSPEIAELFPSAMQESSIGTIPRHWRVDPLGDHLDILETGRRPKGGVSKYTSGVPSVGAESINGIGNYDFAKTKFVPTEFFDSMRSGKVQDYDTLLYKDGGKPGEFKPRIGMYGCGFPFSTFGLNEHVFRMRSASLGVAYLYFHTATDRVFHHLAVRGGKAAIPGINQETVREIDCLVPPTEVIECFNDSVQRLIELILGNALQSAFLAALRDTLLPKLLSGELRVPDAEKAVEEAL
jgi:type I restriction enzyme S subunit